MDLSPDELNVLAAIVHGEGARAPLGLMLALHGPTIESMTGRGLIAAWPGDHLDPPDRRPAPPWWADDPSPEQYERPPGQHVPSVTLTPLAAQWLGVELAERTTLMTDMRWEKARDRGEVSGWNRFETLVVTPYWARTPSDEGDTPRPIETIAVPPGWDDQGSESMPAFGRVPVAPDHYAEPSRPGEYPLPFPDLVPDHRPGPGEERPAVGRRARRRAEKRAG